jgi:hypothetical protein
MLPTAVRRGANDSMHMRLRLAGWRQTRAHRDRSTAGTPQSTACWHAHAQRTCAAAAAAGHLAGRPRAGSGRLHHKARGGLLCCCTARPRPHHHWGCCCYSQDCRRLRGEDRCGRAPAHHRAGARAGLRVVRLLLSGGAACSMLRGAGWRGSKVAGAAACGQRPLQAGAQTQAQQRRGCADATRRTEWSSEASRCRMLGAGGMLRTHPNARTLPATLARAHGGVLLLADHHTHAPSCVNVSADAQL